MTLGVTDDQNYVNIANALREMGSGAKDLAFKPSEIPAAIRGLRSIWGTIEGSILDQIDLQNALDGKAAANHNHDSRYYTESEIDTKLNGKSNTGHTHDDRYYTESEIDTKLNNKSNIDHTHDERYYTEAEINDKFDESTIIKSVSGPIVPFSDGVAAPAGNVTVAIEPVQEGSGDPSPDNVRPITGWTGVKVMRAGKNLLSKFVSGTYYGVTFSVSDDGSVVITGTPTINDVNYYSQKNFILPAGEYFITGGISGDCKIRVGRSSIGKDENIFTASAEENKVNFTLTKPSIIKVSLRIEHKLNQNVSGTFYPMLCRLSDTNIYEPYQGDTYDISFGEAGTVYGGSLDVSSGKLVVDRVKKRCLSSWGWGNNDDTGDFYLSNTKVSSILSGTTNSSIPFLCSHAKFINSSAIKEYGKCWNNSNYHIQIMPPNTTKSEWNTYLDNNDVQILYTLATPLIYQLTPTEVTTLLGQNNIWADTGNVDVSYFTEGGEGISKAFDNVSKSSKYDDDKTREMLTQSSESAMTASKNYTAGNLIIINDKLLRVTANIASGGTITIGTNAEEVDLETVIAEKVSNNLISVSQNFKIVEFSGKRNSEEVFTIGNGARIVVFIIDSTIDNNGVYIIISTASGEVSIIPILSATNLSLSIPSSGKLKITKNATYQFRYIAMIASGEFTLNS